MSWLQTTFIVDADQVETVSTILETFLAQAVTTENAGEDEFYEVAFPGTPDWKKVRVTALFNQAVDCQPIINFVLNHLSQSADQQRDDEIPVTVTKLVDQDWERVWLESFKPIRVGHKLWVCPSWCEPSDPNARNILLDPGLAFGTGTHPTTHMCLRWLSTQDLTAHHVLDYGSGSGILAIAALMSGAKHADAVDIDPLAVDACIENAARNQVNDNMAGFLPSELSVEPQHRYELVIANILAEVIIELQDTLLLHCHANGRLLLTGILATQADRVIDAFKPEFTFEKQLQDQWCLLIGTKMT